MITVSMEDDVAATVADAIRHYTGGMRNTADKLLPVYKRMLASAAEDAERIADRIERDLANVPDQR